MNFEKQIAAFYEEVQKKYHSSDYIKNCPKEYNSISICSTQLARNKTVLVGFNGGAANGVDYSSEENKYVFPPSVTYGECFKKGASELGSFMKVYPLLSDRIGEKEVANCIQTNFCFFRSKYEHEISQNDLETSRKLFLDFMEILQPSRLICFSMSLYNNLKDQLSHDKLESFQNGNRKVFVYKGSLKLKDREVPIFILPHPNARIKSEARKQCWDYCLGKTQK